MKKIFLVVAILVGLSIPVWADDLPLLREQAKNIQLEMAYMQQRGVVLQYQAQELQKQIMDLEKKEMERNKAELEKNKGAVK